MKKFGGESSFYKLSFKKQKLKNQIVTKRSLYIIYFKLILVELKKTYEK